MTKQEELEVGQMGDDEIAGEYLRIQFQIKDGEVKKKYFYTEIRARVEDRGSPYGKDDLGKKIETPLHQMLLEARPRVEVHQDIALKIFDDKSIDDFEVVSTIELKEGVDPSTIPDVLKEQMNDFFLISTSRVVSKEAIEQNRKSGKLSDDEAAACLNRNTTHALKVKGKK